MVEINNVFDDVLEVTVKTPENEVFSFLTIGAALTKWQRQDGTDIICAYKDYNDYYQPGMYLGTVVGPITGRISSDILEISGNIFKVNDKVPNFLHSGHLGLSFRNFQIKEIRAEEDVFLVSFHTNYSHPSLPGELLVVINYRISSSNLEIEFLVQTTEDTLVNLTSHSYFNLDGDFSQGLENHYLTINADKVVTVDTDLIGKDIINVENTVFDFRKQVFLPDMLDSSTLKEQGTNGLDHYFLLNDSRPFDTMLYSSKSNRKLFINSTYPGITVYTTNMPKDNLLHNGERMAFQGAVAMEPHFQSNAVNDKRFAGYLLEKGKLYRHTINYRVEE